MNRKPTHTPVNPWEWFSGAIYHLSKTVVVKIWNVSDRTIERWSADSATTQSVSNNPLVLMGAMLEKLMEKGKMEFARAAVDYLAMIVRVQIRDVVDVLPDGKSISEELLDNLPALARYQEAVRDRKPLPVIRARAMELIAEIEQDLALLDVDAGSRSKD